MPDFLVNRSNWQRCWAGSSKTDPRILIFFNSPGCWILCEIHCYLFPPKSWLDNAFLGSVCNQEMNKQSTTMTQHTLDCVKSDVRTTTLVIYYYWFASKNKLLLAWWIQVTITIDLLIKSGHHNYCVVFQGLKGQLISECLLGVIDFPKQATKNLTNFYLRILKMVKLTK